MKKQNTFFAILAFFLLSTQAFSQLSFGVHTGFGTKSAYLGLKNKTHFMPYVSLQFANLSFINEYDGDSEKGKLGIIMPTLGTKYYFKENGKLKPYLDLTVSKPIFYITPADDFSGVDLWAGSVGFGSEYFLDPQFSVGGEFGFNFLRGKLDNAYEDYSNNGNSYINHETFKVKSNPTYARISVNFYFAKKK